MTIAGTVTGLINQIEVQLVPRGGYAGSTTELIYIPVSSGAFSRSVTVNGGYYDLTAVGYQGYYPLTAATTLRVGVGDVFLMCGQSNSSNNGGLAPTTPTNDAVQSWHSDGSYALAADPQPIADGSLGSTWPAFGDLLAAHTGMPVAIVSVGVGGTYVSTWTPATATLWNSNLLPALSRVGANYRCVLWNLGEYDANNSTSQAAYYNAMTAIIDASRVVIPGLVWGFPVTETWWHSIPGSGAGTSAAQAQAAAYTNCFAGPNTDSLDNTYRKGDEVHWNAAGLTAHATLWLNAIISHFGI